MATPPTRAMFSATKTTTPVVAVTEATVADYPTPCAPTGAAKPNIPKRPAMGVAETMVGVLPTAMTAGDTGRAMSQPADLVQAIRIALCVATVCVALAGCGSSGSSDNAGAVRKAVTDYFQAIRSGQAVKACRLMAQPKRNCARAISAAAVFFKGLTFTVGKPTVTGDTARVDVTFLNTLHMRLKKVSDQWKIVGAVRTPPRKVIDRARAEGFTRRVVVANGGAVKSLSCPRSVVVVTGKTFDCTAVLANGKAFKITFQMTDENGTVKFVSASTA